MELKSQTLGNWQNNSIIGIKKLNGEVKNSNVGQKKSTVRLKKSNVKTNQGVNHE
jgi:hypothetical protein